MQHTTNIHTLSDILKCLVEIAIIAQANVCNAIKEVKFKLKRKTTSYKSIKQLTECRYYNICISEYNSSLFSVYCEVDVFDFDCTRESTKRTCE